MGQWVGIYWEYGAGWLIPSALKPPICHGGCRGRTSTKQHYGWWGWEWPRNTFFKVEISQPPVPLGCSLLLTTGGYIFLKLVVWSSLVPISTNHWGLKPRKKTHISPSKNWDWNKQHVSGIAAERNTPTNPMWNMLSQHESEMQRSQLLPINIFCGLICIIHVYIYIHIHRHFIFLVTFRTKACNNSSHQLLDLPALLISQLSCRRFFCGWECHKRGGAYTYRMGPHS